MGRNQEPSRREPHPHRIINNIGFGFGSGAVAGSAVYFLKGVYGSPRGERLLGGSQAVRMNALPYAGSLAAWLGLVSVFDGSMGYIRQKEDPWNSIIGGAAAGGLLQVRQGFRAAAKSAARGAVLLALIQGGVFMLDNMVLSVPENMKKPNIPNMAAFSGFNTCTRFD